MSEETQGQFGISLPGRNEVRRGAFYGSIVLAIGLYAVLMRDLLPYVVTAWFVDTGIHRLHDLNFFALIWLSIFGLGLQLYQPKNRVTAVILPVLVMGPLAVMAIMTDAPIVMMPVLFMVVGMIVVVLHPAGRGVFRVNRVESVNWITAGFLVVGVVPLVTYGIDQFSKQYTVTDEHTALVHYGAMAVLAVLILGLGALAIVRREDWRFTAWSAGVLAVYLGASSIAFPDASSSVAPVWGGLSVAWGVGFVAAVELSRGGEGLPMRVEASIEIDAPVETVWEVTTDPQTFVKGIDWVYEAWREDDGPFGKGSVYVERAKPGVKEGTYRWEITTYEPPKRIVHYHKGRELEAELEVLLDPIDADTTAYTQVMRFRALPIFRPLGFVLERTIMKRAMQRDFDEMILPNYKRITEERIE